MAHGATYDVLIIGGGASGLAAAFAAAQSGAHVAVLEHDVACGLPILATGNGRCNLSNENLDPRHYSHPSIAAAVMGLQPENTLDAFFQSIGIYTTAIDGRIYPYSKRAESVRDALLNACQRLHVTLIPCASITDAFFNVPAALWKIAYTVPAQPLGVRRQDDFKKYLRAMRKTYKVATQQGQSLTANSVVLATGGKTAHTTCELFHLPFKPLKPVLCPIACHPGPTWGSPRTLPALDGLRVDAKITLLSRNGSPSWGETGEILFRSWGISGMVSFNLSRRIKPGDTFELNLFPSFKNEELMTHLQMRDKIWASPVSLQANAACSEQTWDLPLTSLATEQAPWFDGLIAPALGGELWPSLSQNPTPRHVACILQHLNFIVDGLSDTATAQVTRGGIPWSAVTQQSLALTPKHASQLFACGEVLDMDADCGGFNLAWAWLSGMRAGKAAAYAALGLSTTLNPINETSMHD